MRVLLLLFFLCMIFTTNAQPGIRTIEQNINDFTPGEINSSKSQSENYYYILDKRTDLLKLKNLRALRKINLIANMDALPKEFDCLSDSLTELDIQASYILKDISILRKLKKLKIINVNYEGNSLLKLCNQDSLASLHTQDLDNIDVIVGGAYIKKLYTRHLVDEKLDFNILSKLNVEKLDISDSYKLKDINGIGKWKSLRELNLTLLSAIKNIDFNELANLNLRSLNIWSLENLE